jgi:hypothetical protein
MMAYKSNEVLCSSSMAFREWYISPDGGDKSSILRQSVRLGVVWTKTLDSAFPTRTRPFFRYVVRIEDV